MEIENRKGGSVSGERKGGRKKGRGSGEEIDESKGREGRRGR